MESEIGVTRSIFDELHSLDIQGEETESESGVAQSIIDELDSPGIQRDGMAGEYSVN